GTSAHFWKQISSDNNPPSGDESYPVLFTTGLSRNTGRAFFASFRKTLTSVLNTDDKRPDLCTAIARKDQRASMISASTVMRRHLRNSAAITK
ncbi:hypothetical protein, partial [Xenorhabdus bovienii]|uniref:hypothetical protein n=1 Tax=Xenorhabdus bovienii TaxID=40576 RepID=UPI001E4F7C2F